MPTPTSDKSASLIDIKALGWALSAALVVLFVSCAVIGMIFPSAPLAHGWLALFTLAPMGSVRSFVEGIIYSLGFAWVISLIVGWVYNGLAKL